MAQSKVITNSNSHLRSLLYVKSLLNDTEDDVLSSCIQKLFDTFDSKRNILEILIKCCTETQLQKIKYVIEEAAVIPNKADENNHMQANFAQILNLCGSNIIAFLHKDDINQFKLTSIRIAILCLEAMHAKSNKSIHKMSSTHNKLCISSSSCVSTINEKGSLVQQWNEHVDDMSSKGQSFIMQASAEKCDHVTIQCGCVQRLIIIFCYVNRCNLDSIDAILYIFQRLDGYSIQEFANDLDHIRRFHDTAVNQQFFCGQINFCDRVKCNFQDRSSMIKAVEHSVFNNNISEEKFARFKLIQEAHLYLFHSLPMISDNSGRNEIQRLITEYNDYNTHRSSRFVDRHHDRKNIDYNESSTDYNSNSPKTPKTSKTVESVEMAITDDVIEDEKEYDMDVNSTKAASPLFSYGNRFEYNPHKNFKKNPYYVGCAYENLKKELLDDEDKKYGIKQWNTLIHNSSTLFAMPWSKKVKSIDGKCISIGRILAIRLYCSEGNLASALKETYRESKSLTKAQQKKRHSRFGHWARLLCTTCDLFGINVTETHRCFRGLNNVFIFKSGFSSKLYGPLSTTRHLGVASAFAGHGITLQIEKASSCCTAKFFECNPYSPYRCEQELLFNGHHNYLDVTAIYTIADYGEKMYDTKPVLLLQTLTGKCNIDVGTLIRRWIDKCNITKKLCKLLRKYKEDNDASKKDYILETISYYLTHLKKLDMKVKQTEDLIKICKEINLMDKCKELLSYLIYDVDLLVHEQLFSVDLFELSEILPNTKRISFDMGHCEIKLCKNINSKLWINFIEYMLKTKGNWARGKKKFDRIEFRKLTKQRFPIKILNQVKNSIKECKWNIYIEKVTECDTIKSILFLYGSNVNDKTTNWIAV